MLSLQTIAAANTRQGHSARCKKPLDECTMCQANIAFFAEIPAPLLAIALQPIVRPPLKVSLLDHVRHQFLDGDEHQKANALSIARLCQRLEVKVEQA